MRSRSGRPTGRGVGRSAGHHGEFLQGRFRCNEFGECPGLVTVPARCLSSVAEFVPDGSGTVRVRCAHGRSLPMGKTRTAAAATIAHLLAHGHNGFTGGDLVVRRTIPVGMGMGSSTADVVAAVRAVADAAEVELEASTLARLSVAAEGASDPLWAQRPVLFAHRHGHVIEELDGEFPSMLLLRCRIGGPVDTLALPIAGTADVSVYEELRDMLRDAVRSGDAAGVGEVATRSAQLNQTRHFKPGLDSLVTVAHECGALGVQVAHSGNVAGVLFEVHHPVEWLRRTTIRAEEHGLRVESMPVAVGGAA